MSKHPTSVAHRPLAIRHSSRERGVALILTLAILALVTLLLIAFVTSMRVENMASRNFNNVIAARELAKGAVDQAVGLLRQTMPARTQSPVFTYVTFPGAAYTYNSTAALVVARVPLYSDPTLADPTNLNSGLWITGGTNSLGEFLANNGTINVGWLYVAADGTTGSKTIMSALGKPLIGRFAYWIDDEASKINVNWAAVPPSCSDPLSVCSTSLYVDLTQLLPGPAFPYAADIQAGAGTHPYTTIEEIKRANVGITSAIFDDNRFEITAYSSDGNYPFYADDLDVFDRQRLALNPTTLNGNFNNAVTELSDPILAKVYGTSGSTPNAFASKYGGASGVKQLIANIIGYQIDPTVTAPPTDGSTYIGLARNPCITQIQIEYDVAPGVGGNPATVSRAVSVSLYYMYSGTYTSKLEQIKITGLPAVGLKNTDYAFPSSVTITIPAGTAFNANTSQTFKNSDAAVQLPSDYTAFAATPNIQYTRGWLLDFANPPVLQNQIPASGSTPAVYQGCQVVDDPAVHESEPGDWKQYISLPAPAFTYPAGDVSKVVMRTNQMHSVGELGYIHLPGIAYGHLTLQPNLASTKIPDWALLDLFTIGGGTTGRININGFINPGPLNPRLLAGERRQRPLLALLSSMSAVIAVPATALNIYNDDVSVRSDTYGMSDPSGGGIFDTIGEVCEVLPTSAANQADKEQAIRRIGNLITVRSNTFTIWVLAQSIKQPQGATLGTFTPGVDVITGDVKAQAVVERYESSPGTVNSPVRYRTRYFRYLYN
jgi:hypothetical protein